MITKHHGLSLIEIMLTLFLSSLILAALTGHYLTVKQQYNRMNALLDYALELDWVEDLLRDSIRRAGFTPCVGLNWLESIDARTKKRLLPVTISKNQELSVNRMSEHFNSVFTLTSNVLTIGKSNAYTAGENILIADCYHAEVKEIATIQRTNGNQTITLKTPLNFDYIKPVYLGEWIGERFFIQNNRLGKKAMYYQRDHAEELTSAVNHLSSTLTLNHGTALLQMSLTLSNGETVDVETNVRAF
ncbi:PilW family protein [Legionella hackeliae]|uniref:Putative Prepilin-type N-cleavage/methylation domain protein n=1 Tax=Legionella hackeliae TaxID=449 RepID=A0A0A8UTJ8_LEGHA|nr:hypothetical protein [Legionella hackeliae]KTD10574.1 hypothetical protein Lhac_2942 [Legionella hackeliae]CEK10079.1 putative Prepilin-type N-cleavage/methylation domain protein [Legionella hackeliae]STX46803.1 Tfp pilus assembly protein PilW [Legionella hackeliae]